MRRGNRNVCLKGGVGERVLCGNGIWASLIDFSDSAIQMPDSTIESAESLCLSVESDQLLFLDEF